MSACGGSDSSPQPGTHSLSGSISGLTAAGLVLANGSATMTLSAGATSFTSASAFQSGQSYAVTVRTQPAGLICSVANATGTFSTANVNDLAVTCVSTYALGGTISGLSEDGLALTNNGENLPVSPSAGTFVFATRFTTGTTYAVTAQSVPSGLTCSVANGTGSLGTANVNNVVVTCSKQAYSLGGTVSGLNGSGLVLANGTDRMTVPSGSATFTMPAAVAYTSSYSVTVDTQPQGVTCAVQNGTGVMGASAVTNVAVTCSDQPYTLGGTVSGLSGAGLVLANDTDTVQVPANASTFTLPTRVAFSISYAVTVASQPVGITCSVSNGSGTMPAANVTAVSAVCSSNAYTLGGSITGLTNGGLVLTDGTDTVTVAAGAANFKMPTAVAFGSHYQVTVATQPTNSACTVSNGAATMPAADVNDIAVTCAITAYTLGGSISGLTASGLILSDGTDQLAVAANAAVFSMPTGLAVGSAYAVTVAAQPAGLLCTVTNGSSTMPSADVNSVQVACLARAWTWVAGSNTIGAEGSYGTLGVAAAGNAPSERDSSMNWTDGSGRFWLFGGSDQYSGRGNLNDLWMYDPGTQLWTWMNGPSTANSAGTYGTQGLASAGNVPRSRHSGVTWADSAGHLWLFGGYNDNSGIAGCLNDLWMYDIATNQWTWIGGPSAANDMGSYGAQGVAAVGNTPPSRVYGLSWTDSAGHFWLSGGSNSGGGVLSDLWMYDAAGRLWTWVNGSNTTTNVTSTYGSKGLGAVGNTPGSRHGSATWADGSRHLWLFGGTAIDPSANQVDYGDLWMYDIASNLWTWMGGANTSNPAGTYGTLGIADAANTPGARDEMASWVDNAGRFWMFGGFGNGAAVGSNWLSDLWMYDPATHQWTWVKGPTSPGSAAGVYGTKGVAAAGNLPGGRVFPLSWVDGSGGLWMFGGYGADVNGAHYDLNDLWKF
jgi:Galactose oxidase, central domain